MKSRFVQGVTVCLVHLLLLANAYPIRSNKVSPKRHKPIIRTSYYTPYVPDPIIPSSTQDVPNPTISSSTQDVPKSIISMSDDRQDDTDSNVDDEGLHDPDTAPSAHVMESEHPYRVTYEEISEPNAPKELVDRMLHDRVTTVSAPWHTEGEWSTPVLQVMVQYLRKRKSNYIKNNRRKRGGQSAVEGGTSRSQRRKARTGSERTELITEMSSLWLWATKELMGVSKRMRVDNAQVTLQHIESGVIEVDDAEFMATLLASVPIDDHLDSSKMPWHAGDDDVFRWKKDLTIGYVKKVLPYIWGQLMRKGSALKGENKVSKAKQEIWMGRQRGCLMRWIRHGNSCLSREPNSQN